ncbi:DUF6588 family protein [Gaetbulibacter saemankumensis]|uniref:DUF6588 family protein n=1 Tax=Gaetbulibacter saemankumensis TaxID=311208 RepID=UPI0004845F9E|nr:DUF6588 family protein [Gaetbulibacter saemankumensis]
MKKIILSVMAVMAAMSLHAQSGLGGLLDAGVENAERFSNDFLNPGAKAVMHSMNANWFNSGDSKPLGGFEISIIANAAIAKKADRTFTMNIADYNSDDYNFKVEFADGPNVVSKNVSSVFGENKEDVELIIKSKINPLIEDRITLPSGVGIDYMPTGYIQGALGLIKGLEVKARLLPKVKTDEFEASMVGGALQAEFTKWLPADKILPVAVSGLVAYTHLGGEYDLTESSGIFGQDQRIENSTDTWLFQLIASTKLPVINFYGGVGYISGESSSDVLGTYQVNNGVLSETVTDPFSVTSTVESVRGTIGAKLKLSVFRLNAEYHISEFNSFAIGLNFGFR